MVTPGKITGPRGIGVLHDQFLLAAHKPLMVIANERSGEEMRFAQDLETIADAKH